PVHPVHLLNKPVFTGQRTITAGTPATITTAAFTHIVKGTNSIITTIRQPLQKAVSPAETGRNTQQAPPIYTLNRPSLPTNRMSIAANEKVLGGEEGQQNYYYHQGKAELESLKKTVEELEKQAHKKEKIIEQSTKHRFAAAAMKTSAGEIDINHLTDRVYRMLERKIQIEKERRGI
ncbi:MAG: hypothetical protein GY757_35700, partial [bacterium]|nr:hypothetical protein [bacterium]